ncbi:MAG: hypothetical protein M3480_10980 [Verrucomicrobiota bacterium]|nr:transposase [Chthoniobacterales bacterium]MDQ3415472.1 hypothetical protein [Verrucomicrobiota bacterium]
MQRTPKRKPPRLDRIFQSYDAPVFFVTFNTHGRRPILACREVHDAFVDYCTKASEYHVGVGRYVLMPDHIHLFASFGSGATTTLGVWMKGLKRCLDRCLLSLGREPLAVPGQKLRSFWQPGFHDHLLRSDEGYAQKWDYVRENPVRARLVSKADAWPYAGEIVRIDRV